jgi:hypothetical protein
MVRSRFPFDALTPNPDYASLPIADGFTWGACFDALPNQEWYLVAFRSILRPTADLPLLDEYDLRAHREASRRPGFVHYFHGTPNQWNECLSFCIWESRQHARDAAKHPAHLQAVSVVQEMYESYVLEFYRVRKDPGSTELTFEDYDLVPTG